MFYSLIEAGVPVLMLTFLSRQLLDEKLLMGGWCQVLRHFSLKVNSILYTEQTASHMQGFCEGVRTLCVSVKRLNLKLDALLVSTAHFLFLYDKQERSFSCAAEAVAV